MGSMLPKIVNFLQENASRIGLLGLICVGAILLKMIRINGGDLVESDNFPIVKYVAPGRKS